MATHGSRLTHSLPAPAFSENGQLEPFSEFPYDEVEAALAKRNLVVGPVASSQGGISFEAIVEAAAEQGVIAGKQIFSALVNWIWQDGMKDERVIQIRAVIVCWVFLKHLHPLNLTELARGFGKDKQSLGRWVDDFKLKFPTIRNPHMQ